MMKITHVIINSQSYEVEYDMQRPVEQFAELLAEIDRHHPSRTSVVITLVEDKP